MPAAKKNAKKAKVEEAKPTRLYRSERNRVLGGVAGGLGDFFNVDPTLIRLIFVVATIFGGGGVLLYIILWLIIPTESQSSEITNESIKGSVEEMRDKAHEFAKEMKISHRGSQRRENTRVAFALILLIIGIVILANNFGFVRMIYVVKFWPLILIFLALAILLGRD